jgi:hypothetical protein
MVGTSRGGSEGDESEKLEREVQRQKMVERNHKAGQNPPRVVASSEEEEEACDHILSPFSYLKFKNSDQNAVHRWKCFDTFIFPLIVSDIGLLKSPILLFMVFFVHKVVQTFMNTMKSCFSKLHLR